jgi:hypothetical protein
MSTESNVISANSATSMATQIAILAVESEQADYEAQSTIRDAERASKCEHDKEQIATIREKAGDLLADGIVTGSLLMAASAAQLGTANARYDANKANTALEDRNLDPNAAPGLAATKNTGNLVADWYAAAPTFLQGGAKTSDLVFNSVVTNKEADAAGEGNLAQDAQTRADDANAARLRALSQLDGKLSIAQEMLSAEAETMHMLIRPA